MLKLPTNKQVILDLIVADLTKIESIVAVVLGGSHCTGMASEKSDLDIGIYYHETEPFDIDQIRRLAQKYHTDEAPTVTGFYEWGAWVNGGAWINTESGEVDFLYRNIQQVKSTIEKSKNGIWENDFEQQPPYGFSSVIYLAETHYCLPLYDPYQVIEDLKREVKTYPPKLAQTIVQQALWSAEFSLWQADKFTEKQDAFNAAGCFTRTLKSITEALLALNETYSLGDKSAIQRIVQLPKCPGQFKEQIDGILSINSQDLPTNARRLRNLFEQVVSLAGGKYQPYFVL